MLRYQREAKGPLLLLFGLLSASCATTNVPSWYNLAPEKSEGLLVVSLSHQGLRGAESPEWFYRPIETKDGKSVIPGTWLTPLDWTSPPGKLFYLALPPGRYEFHRCGLTRTSASVPTWRMGSGGIVTNNNPVYSGADYARYATEALYAKPFSIPFEIFPSQATYIGNLHFVSNGIEAKVVVSNESRRDLALLQQRLSNLRSEQIRVEIARNFGWNTRTNHKFPVLRDDIVREVM